MSLYRTGLLPTVANELANCKLNLVAVQWTDSYLEVFSQGDGMGEACSTHGTDEKCIQNSGRKTWREETTPKT